MAYKLAEEDKLCGVIYPTYEGFKPIPKATCEMLESKCDKTEIIVKCKDNQSEEDKKPESQSGSTTLSTSESTSVSPSESSSTENSNTPEEPKPTPEPQPEPIPEIDLLEVLPKVEDKFSKIITKDGQVVEVPEVSNEDKRAFEDKIINDLKAKLPEGTTVEAVLEGPAYEKGSEVIGGKTNYNLKVRTTLNGKVTEHTYKVPHTDEPDDDETRVLKDEIANLAKNNTIGLVVYDGISDYEYSPAIGLENAEGAFNKFKENHPEYNISYKIINPKDSPKTFEDKDKNKLYSVKFTVTKGESSFNVTEYIPFDVVTIETL